MIAVCLQGSNLDKEGLILMGISPKHPSKDYGYISTKPKKLKLSLYKIL